MVLLNLLKKYAMMVDVLVWELKVTDEQHKLMIDLLKLLEQFLK